MRVLRPVIQISTLSVLDAGKQLTLSNPIAARLVGRDHPRDVVQAFQQAFEEALDGFGVVPGLNQNVQHNAIRIEGVQPSIRIKTSSVCHLSPDRGRRRRSRSAKLAANFLHQRRTEPRRVCRRL